jgi:hypothetical protein
VCIIRKVPRNNTQHTISNDKCSYTHVEPDQNYRQHFWYTFPLSFPSARCVPTRRFLPAYL